jgi:hypothetical protein
MITKPAGTAMTEGQLNYLISLVGQLYGGAPALRTKALLEAAGFDFNGASTQIDTYKAVLQGKTVPGVPAAVKAELAYDVPTGHYMVNGEHVWVKKGKYGSSKSLEVAGKWLGYLYSQKAIVWLNEHLGTEATAYACVLEYSKVTSKCGVCNTKLTDPKSIAAGIGPVCAKYYGIKI